MAKKITSDRKKTSKDKNTKSKEEPAVEDVISITSEKIDVEQIMKSLKKDILNKKKEYFEFLQKKTPPVIDVADDGEYLLNGWYDVDSIAGIRARWTKKKFSFFFDVKDSSHIYLEIVSLPFAFRKSKSVSLTVCIEGKKIETLTLSHTGVYVVPIPAEFRNQPVVFQLELSDTFVPMEHRMGPDTRELGIALKTISIYNTSSQSFQILRSIDERQENFYKEMGVLQSHADTKDFVFKNHKVNILKKFWLRLMDIYFRVQIVFNKRTTEQLEKQHEHTNKVLKVVTSLEYEQQVHMQETENRFVSMFPTQPKYFPTYEDDFYVFQQNKLRGSYEDIKKRQQAYVNHIKTVTELNESHPFIEAGFGRGEFIEILKENGVSNIIGVDTNSTYVESARKRGTTVYQDDIISFMDDYKGKISGFSAFHLLEHIEFGRMFDLLYMVKKKLAPGGMVIAETPNVENLVVGSCTFHYDHTHKTKLSPVFLTTVFEYLGFAKIEVKTLAPVRKDAKTQTEKLLFGPQDFAVIAWK